MLNINEDRRSVCAVCQKPLALATRQPVPPPPFTLSPVEGSPGALNLEPSYSGNR